jgi:hypothetical protein
MIDAASIREIIATYAKHGWTLRRVLLSAELKKRIATEITGLFDDAVLIDSDINAAWFSRQSRPSSVAWELRRLGPLPFALVEVVDINLPPDELENVLSEAEDQLRQTAFKPRTNG